jgi:DNA-binding transcriptional regulator YdaS (Cro superfamily)
MTEQLAVVPADVDQVLMDWADNAAELACSLAAAIRRGASLTELRQAAFEHARSSLRLTGRMIQLFDAADGT